MSLIRWAWARLSQNQWQFYKSFSSGLKDIVWKSEASAEEEKTR